MTRRSLPFAFYLNALASLLLFVAIFVTEPRVHIGLQWLGGSALFCAIVALILKK